MLFEMDTELLAFAGMLMILSAFFLETRSVIQSKATSYLMLMAFGSGLLAIRAFLIEEWAFFILEVAWFLTAMAGYFTRNTGEKVDISSDNDEITADEA
ncbi:MAG: hypothetical protein HOL22_03615 [Euryarchaeota archaeon]|jgi:hypothetical protein|nr:hypothetical protein [Euryarchaeota archaeon]MBT5594786.1 hypothetical protein [Euryarchaeota archaeon]MBT5844025.1 hypothetical protein [Euryarchaeota archaeon]MBT6844806.1 hypothetical protein [Euryarchaeota archaeon]MBT7064410.1 hypothetical protein [Euryarchaeota archaeon]